MEPILLPAAIEEIIRLDCEGPRELHSPLESSAPLAAVQVYFSILLQSVPPYGSVCMSGLYAGHCCLPALCHDPPHLEQANLTLACVGA